MILSSFSIINDLNKAITGDLRYLDNQKPKPAILVFHGFKGFKDWGFLPYISEKMAEKGAITLCINFSMNGYIEGSDRIENPDDFSSNTLSIQLKDAKLLSDAFFEGKILKEDRLKQNWNGEIYAVGHSLGGGMAILSAKFDSRISKIAVWASIATFRRYTARQQQIWRELGYNEFTISRTGQVLRMKIDYLDDVEKNADVYDLNSAIANLKIPALIVHGKQDVTVPLREAKMLYDSSDKNITEIFEIPRAGHTFGIDHPFMESTQALELALEKTINFFGLV